MGDITDSFTRKSVLDKLSSGPISFGYVPQPSTKTIGKIVPGIPVTGLGVGITIEEVRDLFSGKKRAFIYSRVSFYDKCILNVF